MFQFPAFAPPCAVIPLQGIGFPHSEIHGSRAICASPWLIAACHVLLRLWEPRHPPYALTWLSRLEFNCKSFIWGFKGLKGFKGFKGDRPLDLEPLKPFQLLNLFNLFITFDSSFVFSYMSCFSNMSKGSLRLTRRVDSQESLPALPYGIETTEIAWKPQATFSILNPESWILKAGRASNSKF